MGSPGEGPALGGFRDRQALSHRALRPPDQQDDPTTEQVHLPSEPQQEQEQRLSGQLDGEGGNEKVGGARGDTLDTNMKD